LEVLKFVETMIPRLGQAMPARNQLGDAEKLNDVSEPLMEGGKVSFVAGTIKDGEQDRMKRMLFRVTRGKALTHFHEFIQPVTGETKAVYLVVYANLKTMRDQVQKICDSFMGQRFEIPDFGLIGDQTHETRVDISKAEGLLTTSEQTLREYLKSINRINGVKKRTRQYQRSRGNALVRRKRESDLLRSQPDEESLIHLHLLPLGPSREGVNHERRPPVVPLN